MKHIFKMNISQLPEFNKWINSVKLRLVLRYSIINIEKIWFNSKAINKNVIKHSLKCNLE